MSLQETSSQRPEPILVMWRGYPESQNFWKYEIPLLQYCPCTVDMFERREQRCLETKVISISTGEGKQVDGQNMAGARVYPSSPSVARVIAQLGLSHKLGVIIPRLSF